MKRTESMGSYVGPAVISSRGRPGPFTPRPGEAGFRVAGDGLLGSGMDAWRVGLTAKPILRRIAGSARVVCIGP